MAYEFKKLSAVEAVEAVSDAATVLIEENGVIKKAPKDEIGGGIKVASTAEVGQTIVVKAVDESGNPTEWECADMSKGEEPDMVITVSANSATALTSDNYAITEGSVDNVFAAFHAGRYPIIKVRFYLNGNTDYTAIREEYDAYACTYGESLWFSFTTLNPYYSTNFNVHKVYMNGDGTLSSAEVKKATLTTS